MWENSDTFISLQLPNFVHADMQTEVAVQNKISPVFKGLCGIVLFEIQIRHNIQSLSKHVGYMIVSVSHRSTNQ